MGVALTAMEHRHSEAISEVSYYFNITFARLISVLAGYESSRTFARRSGRTPRCQKDNLRSQS